LLGNLELARGNRDLIARRDLDVLIRHGETPISCWCGDGKYMNRCGKCLLGT
jgi:hypothetical protein